MQGIRQENTIVVGVDGSENGRRALIWAVDEARRRGMRCRLIHAVNYGATASGMYMGPGLDGFDDIGKAVLAGELELARDLGVIAEGQLEIGPAAPVLIEASKDAAMLVVGSRGHNGLTGLLLGSVSTSCVHHAECPIVVVPPEQRRRVVAGDHVSTTAS